jgi:predicted Zn-dependent protease
VQAIWQPLLAAARLRGELSPELDERFAFEIMMGRDRTVNAFALPGGYFGLHLGLLAVVTSRDELASVLGHELSHVTQRHISRLISKQSAQTPWVIGAMILGALAASKSADAANALIAGGQAVAAQSQLNFSRDMEREADRVGFGVMTQAGFDPQGFVTMFDKLQNASRLNDNGSYPYLRSHPLTTERIADMQARQPLGGVSGGAPVAVQSLAHAMVSSRANVLSNPNVDALRAWGVQVSSPAFARLDEPRQAAALYGAAMASARLREFANLPPLISKLDALAAHDPAAARQVRMLTAELALEANDPRPAVALMLGQTLAQSTLNANTVSGRPELMLSSQALIRTGTPAMVDQAAQQLQTWVATHPRDAQAWQLLAGAYSAQGQALRAIRADAEVRVAHRDFSGANDRFKAAQELAREQARRGRVDHIEASIIDTRSRQNALLLKEEAVER